jgi:hypothetical protein
MNALLSERRVKGGKRNTTTTVRVFKVGRGPVLLGAILLNAEGRTLRCTPDLPADVILKVLFRFTRRDEGSGELQGRDGALYAWQVLGREAEAA